MRYTRWYSNSLLRNSISTCNFRCLLAQFSPMSSQPDKTEQKRNKFYWVEEGPSQYRIRVRIKQFSWFIANFLAWDRFLVSDPFFRTVSYDSAFFKPWSIPSMLFFRFLRSPVRRRDALETIDKNSESPNSPQVMVSYDAFRKESHPRISFRYQ